MRVSLTIKIKIKLFHWSIEFSWIDHSHFTRKKSSFNFVIVSSAPCQTNRIKGSLSRPSPKWQNLGSLRSRNFGSLSSGIPSRANQGLHISATPYPPAMQQLQMYLLLVLLHSWQYGCICLCVPGLSWMVGSWSWGPCSFLPASSGRRLLPANPDVLTPL